MRVIVCGSRYWTEAVPILRELEKLPEETTVLQGGCRGADEIAARTALLLHMRVETFPADWSIGKYAGNLRNQKMLDSGADLVLAFHRDLEGTSRGTKDMVGRARAAGVEVRVFAR